MEGIFGWSYNIYNSPAFKFAYPWGTNAQNIYIKPANIPGNTGDPSYNNCGLYDGAFLGLQWTNDFKFYDTVSQTGGTLSNSIPEPDFQRSNAPYNLRISPACYHGDDDDEIDGSGIPKARVRISWISADSEGPLADPSIIISDPSGQHQNSGTLAGGLLNTGPLNMTNALGGQSADSPGSGTQGYKYWYNYTTLIDCNYGDNHLTINGHYVKFNYPNKPKIFFIGDVDLKQGGPPPSDGVVGLPAVFKDAINVATDASGGGVNALYNVVCWAGDNGYAPDQPDLFYNLIFGPSGGMPPVPPGLGDTHPFYSALHICLMGNHDYDRSGWADGHIANKDNNQIAGKAITHTTLTGDTWGMKYLEASGGAWWQNKNAWTSSHNDTGTEDYKALPPDTTFGLYYFPGEDDDGPIFIFSIDNAWETDKIFIEHDASMCGQNTTDGPWLCSSDDVVPAWDWSIVTKENPSCIISTNHWDSLSLGARQSGKDAALAISTNCPHIPTICNINHVHQNTVADIAGGDSVILTFYSAANGYGDNGTLGGVDELKYNTPTLLTYDSSSGAVQLLQYGNDEPHYTMPIDNGTGLTIVKSIDNITIDRTIEPKFAHHYVDGVPEYCQYMDRVDVNNVKYTLVNEYLRCTHIHRNSENINELCPYPEHPYFECELYAEKDGDSDNDEEK